MRCHMPRHTVSFKLSISCAHTSKYYPREIYIELNLCYKYIFYFHIQGFYLKLENLSCFKLFLLLLTLWTTHLGTHTHTYTHARVTETAVDLVPNRKEKKMKEKAARGAAWRSCCCCCCWGCSWLLVQGARFDTSDLM